jgi:PKD repeat protein
MRYTTILLLQLISTVSLFAQNPCQSLRYKEPVFSDTVVTKDLKFATADPYGVADNQDLLLDIYEPAGDTISKRPVIVYMYGGAFLIGLKEQPPIPYYAQYFTSLGYVFVAFNYRLGFNVTLPGSPERAVYRSVQDQRAAVRYLAQRANQYRLDTSKFVLMGSSAGCIAGFHSTYMEYSEAAAFSTPVPVLDGENLGAVDTSGNSDFNFKYLEPFAIINQWGALVDTGMIDPDERTPVVSFHGDQDNAVRYEYGYPFSYPVFPALYGSKPIHEKLNQMGIVNELHTLEGYGHEPELTDLGLRDTILYYSKEFLYPLLKPNTSSITGPSAICTGYAATYAVNYASGSTYCWQLTGNGNIVSNTGNSITVIWADTGTVTVAVMERTINGTSGELKSMNTQVVLSVNSSFMYQANELQVLLLNQTTNTQNVFWNFGDNTTSTDFTPIKNYTTGGTYTITLIADNSVCSDTFSQTLTIDSCPVAFFNATLSNLNGIFNAQGTNTSTYQWYWGDGQSINTASPNVLHVYNQPGLYDVTLIVKNQLNCADTFQTQINFAPTAIEEETQRNYLEFMFGRLKVNLTAATIHTLHLYSITGSLVATHILNSSKEFDISALSNGSYIAVLSDAGKRQLSAIRFQINR